MRDVLHALTPHALSSHALYLQATEKPPPHDFCVTPLASSPATCPELHAPRSCMLLYLTLFAKRPLAETNPSCHA